MAKSKGLNFEALYIDVIDRSKRTDKDIQYLQAAVAKLKQYAAETDAEVKVIRLQELGEIVERMSKLGRDIRDGHPEIPWEIIGVLRSQEVEYVEAAEEHFARLCDVFENQLLPELAQRKIWQDQMVEHLRPFVAAEYEMFHIQLAAEKLYDLLWNANDLTTVDRTQRYVNVGDVFHLNEVGDIRRLANLVEQERRFSEKLAALEGLEVTGVVDSSPTDEQESTETQEVLPGAAESKGGASESMASVEQQEQGREEYERKARQLVREYQAIMKSIQKIPKTNTSYVEKAYAEYQLHYFLRQFVKVGEGYRNVETVNAAMLGDLRTALSFIRQLQRPASELNELDLFVQLHGGEFAGDAKYVNFMKLCQMLVELPDDISDGNIPAEVTREVDRIILSPIKAESPLVSEAKLDGKLNAVLREANELAGAALSHRRSVKEKLIKEENLNGLYWGEDRQLLEDTKMQESGFVELQEMYRPLLVAKNQAVLLDARAKLNELIRLDPQTDASKLAILHQLVVIGETVNVLRDVLAQSDSEMMWLYKFVWCRHSIIHSADEPNARQAMKNLMDGDLVEYVAPMLEEIDVLVDYVATGSAALAGKDLSAEAVSPMDAFSQQLSSEENSIIVEESQFRWHLETIQFWLDRFMPALEEVAQELTEPQEEDGLDHEQQVKQMMLVHASMMLCSLFGETNRKVEENAYTHNRTIIRSEEWSPIARHLTQFSRLRDRFAHGIGVGFNPGEGPGQGEIKDQETALSQLRAFVRAIASFPHENPLHLMSQKEFKLRWLRNVKQGYAPYQLLKLLDQKVDTPVKQLAAVMEGSMEDRNHKLFKKVISNYIDFLRKPDDEDGNGDHRSYAEEINEHYQRIKDSEADCVPPAEEDTAYLREVFMNAVLHWLGGELETVIRRGRDNHPQMKAQISSPEIAELGQDLHVTPPQYSLAQVENSPPEEPESVASAAAAGMFTPERRKRPLQGETPEGADTVDRYGNAESLDETAETVASRSGTQVQSEVPSKISGVARGLFRSPLKRPRKEGDDPADHPSGGSDNKRPGSPAGEKN